MNLKKANKEKSPLKSKKLPNLWHRAEKWSGGRIERDRTKYTRKDKHKSKKEE